MFSHVFYVCLSYFVFQYFPFPKLTLPIISSLQFWKPFSKTKLKIENQIYFIKHLHHCGLHLLGKFCQFRTSKWIILITSLPRVGTLSILTFLLVISSKCYIEMCKYCSVVSHDWQTLGTCWVSQVTSAAHSDSPTSTLQF